MSSCIFRLKQILTWLLCIGSVCVCDCLGVHMTCHFQRFTVCGRACLIHEVIITIAQLCLHICNGIVVNGLITEHMVVNMNSFIVKF